MKLVDVIPVPEQGDPGLWSDHLEGIATAVKDTYVPKYVIDRELAGTDATDHIQSKLDSAKLIAGLTGRRVEVEVPASANGDPFVFTELVVGGNVTFRSSGGVLKLADGTCTDGGQAYYLVHNLNLAEGGTYGGARFIDLVIDGNGDNNNLSLVADIITAGGDDVVVWNCDLRNAPDSGIMFSGGRNAVCGLNRIDGCPDLGIYINDGDGDNAYESLVFGNRITNCLQGGIAGKRILQRHIISSNTITDCGNGITLENASTSSDYSKNVQIIGNRIRHIGYGAGSPAGRGIDLRAAHHTICIGNRVEDCNNYGIILSAAAHATVHGNVITMTADSAANARGLFITDRDGIGSTFCTVTGNTVDGARQGIRVEATGGGACRYNVISANTVSVTASIAMGLRGGCEHNTITDNVLSGATADLEHLSTATNNTLSNNKLVNGTSTGNPDQASQTAHLVMRDKKMTQGAAAPTTGTWATGDICWSRTPGHAGAGWVCTAGGTPGTWKAFGHSQLNVTTTWDPASIPAASAVSTAIAVSGAAVTDVVEASLSTIGTTDLLISAHVQAAGAVRVVLFNPTSGAINPAEGTLTVNVKRIS